jgi:acyl-CoA reductase-like NAD-dependent aldehyde dehydrogenase
VLEVDPAFAPDLTVMPEVPVEAPLLLYMLAVRIDEAAMPTDAINILKADRDARKYLLAHSDVNMQTIYPAAAL